MATKYRSGTAVKSGYYFNAMRWAIEPVARDGERLPEGNGEWIRVPTAMALVLTPILGATFLMFLPLIGFILTLQAITAPLRNVFARSATDLAATVSPGWAPGEAHFTGKPGESAEVEEKGPPAAADERLEALGKEIEAKRRHG